jgi:hypothetical protein
MFFLVGCNKNIDDQYLQEGNNEYIENEETLDYEAIIDPNGYNIPLNKVMRVNR